MSKVTMADALAAGDGVILDELSDRIKDLEAERDELLEALGWYAYVTEDANRYGITRDLAQAELRSDRGKRAKKAIAKVLGENNE